MVGDQPNSLTCRWCLMVVIHPWHDNGTPTAHQWLWSRGQLFGSPAHYTKDNNYGA